MFWALRNQPDFWCSTQTPKQASTLCSPNKWLACSGSEIYLRRPSRYHRPTNEPETFAQITELARTKKETAIGYITKAGLMRLAPKPKETHTYSAEDRIIVIADD